MYTDIIYVCLALLTNINAVHHHGTLHEAYNDIADTRQHAPKPDIKTYIENQELEYCNSKSDTKHLKVKTKSDNKAESRLGDVPYSENKGEKDDTKHEQETCAKEAVFKQRKRKYSETCSKKIYDKVDVFNKKTEGESEYDKRPEQCDEHGSSKSCKKTVTKLDEPEKVVDGESAFRKSVKQGEKKCKKKKCKKHKKPKCDKICGPGQVCPKQELPKPCLVTPSEKVQIADTCYMKELLSNVYGASELSYDRTGRKLFFAFTANDPSLSGRAYYDLKKEVIVQIPGVYNTRATAVDEKTGVVYFGSTDGLYEYNSKNNNATSIGFRRFNVKKLAMRNCVMCMIAGCKRKLYTLEPEIDYIHKVYIAKRVGHWEDVQQLDIDAKQRLHITVRDIGLFCLDKHGKSILNSDLTDVDLLVSDGMNMFGIVASEMWLINCKRGSAKKYAELDFEPLSMVFSQNDIFISTCNKIYHLRRC